MQKSNLQIIVIAIFLVALVAGVLIFAGIIPVGSSTPAGATGDVVLWGTASRALVLPALDELNRADKTYRIIYVEKDPATFDNDLTQALASGIGPDLFFMSDDLILRHTDKAFITPYTTLPQKTFSDTYISEAGLYLNASGVVAYPFTVDPMVMYYNKDLLEGAGVVKPPAYWDEFGSLASKVTELGQSKNVVKSAVAFGTYSNVNYAKDILSAILIQRGNPIVSRDLPTGTAGAFSLRSRLSDALGAQTVPAVDVLSFYTDFSNSVKNVYSWNPALPNSLDAFIAGDLGVYFGYASELLKIQEKNPNLNFDVAPMPQTRGSSIKATFGRMNAIAISKASKNLSTAFTAAVQMSGADFSGKVAAALNLPPVRRDLLSAKPVSPYYLSTFYDSALISRAWLDPSAQATDQIFRRMTEDVTSGRLPANESVQKANDQLNLLVGTQ
jgi:ABC-type glycerol-3-phosphate transport system substrate-binding protein